jgi:hypothetical protein
MKVFSNGFANEEETDEGKLGAVGGGVLGMGSLVLREFGRL